MQAATPFLIAASGLVAAAVTWLLATRRIPSPLAHPVARSLHYEAVPRAGGIGIWAGWAVVWLAAPVAAAWLVPLAIVVAISLLDDIRGVLPRIRILVHLGAAIPVAMLWLGADVTLMVVEVLIIAWMCNLYNFMDGADGLAGSMGVAGFGAYALAATQSGEVGFATLNGGLALACAGFLVFNLPPARLFMGDVGAIGLGFAAGAFGLKGWADGIWPWWFAPLVFAPFIVDATVTLLRRMRRRAPLALSHRDHFYQQSILKDGRHGPTVAAYVAWMAVCASAALAALRWAPEAGPIVLMVISGSFGWFCHRIDQRAGPAPETQNAG